MNLIEFYYYNLGEEPKLKEKEITEKTFNHLKDNGYDEKFLINNIKIFPPKMVLEFKDIPDDLWKDSILKKGIFYYHNKLHILSPAPFWDLENNKVVTHKFYLEMKIKFTVTNLIDYYYDNFPKMDNLIEESKDIGAINYLYKRYESIIDIVEPVDFILFLIDEAKESGENIEDILSLKKFEEKTLTYLKAKVLNAKAENKNKIIWR